MPMNLSNLNSRPLYLPNVSTPPIAVYGAHRMVRGYNGPLFRLVRIADSVTRDIYANFDNTPNVQGVQGFFNGATQCQIDTIYDQTGAGNHATQVTVNKRPFFTLPVLLNGVPTITAINQLSSITFDGNQNQGFFNIPTGVTAGGQASSLVSIHSFTSSNAAIPCMLGQAWNTAGSFTLIAAQSGASGIFTEVLSDTSFLSAGAHGRSQPQCMIVASGASNIVLYADEVTSTLSANGHSASWQGGFIGEGGNVPGPFNGEWYGLAIYGATLTANDTKAIKSYVYNKYKVYNTLNTQMILTGNSIVQGTAATLNQYNIRIAEPQFSRPIYISNYGVFGQAASTLHAQITRYTVQFNGALSKNIAVIIEPTNDINAAASGNIAAPSTAGGGGGGSVGTNTWNNYTLPDIQSLEAAGFTVLVPTILNRSWTGSGTDITQKTAAQLDWNTLALASGRTVLDYQSIPNMSNPANTTYFADGTHPTSLGYALMAALQVPIINALI